MDIRELEIFLTLAETLHFNRASQACNLSPSALTRTIQRLEEQVGYPLFLRDNRTTALSPAGEQFRNYARQALKDWRAFRSELKEGTAVAGTLSIYASITAVYSLLPDLLEAYRAAYPEVQIELRTGSAEQAVGLVQSGETDIAVAALPERRGPSLDFLPITTTDLIFIAPARGPVAEMLSPEGPLDLSRLPLVLPRTGLSRRRMDAWLKDNRISPNISSEVTGNEAIIAMVRLGCGLGIVPQLVLERSPFREEVLVVEKAPRLEPYIVGLCAERQNLQRPGLQAFWNLARQRSG